LTNPPSHEHRADQRPQRGKGRGYLSVLRFVGGPALDNPCIT
jgi:hypothetical protein